MRTQEELAERMELALARDMFGFESNEYALCMTAETVKPFLKEGATGDWPLPKAIEQIDVEAKGYMSFWHQKIEAQR